MKAMPRKTPSALMCESDSQVFCLFLPLPARRKTRASRIAPAKSSRFYYWGCWGKGAGEFDKGLYVAACEGALLPQISREGKTSVDLFWELVDFQSNFSNYPR